MSEAAGVAAAELEPGVAGRVVAEPPPQAADERQDDYSGNEPAACQGSDGNL